jgi:hypothetical protein
MESPAVASVTPSVGADTSRPRSSLPHRDQAEVIIISSPKKEGEKSTAASEGVVEEQMVEASFNDTATATKVASSKKRDEALANKAPIADKATTPISGVKAMTKDTPAAVKAAGTNTRVEATAKDALVIITPATSKKTVEASSSAPKAAYLTVKGPDGSIKKTLTIKEVLE